MERKTGLFSGPFVRGPEDMKEMQQSACKVGSSRGGDGGFEAANLA